MVISFSSALVVEFCKQLKINEMQNATFGTHNKTLVTRYLRKVRLGISVYCFYAYIYLYAEKAVRAQAGGLAI